MMSKIRRSMAGNEGFTLIELMIVVAIIGILAAVAVPNFISYRDRARVASAVASMESVRASLSAYAADSTGNTYPPANLATYADLLAVVNAYGAALPTDQGSVGISELAYTTADVGETYSIAVTTLAPATMTGHTLTVSPSGIIRDVPAPPAP